MANVARVTAGSSGMGADSAKAFANVQLRFVDSLLENEGFRSIIPMACYGKSLTGIGAVAAFFLRLKQVNISLVKTFALMEA